MSYIPSGLLRANQSTAKYTFAESTMARLGAAIDDLLKDIDPEAEHLSDRNGALTVFQKTEADPKATIPGTRQVAGYHAIVTIDVGPAR